MEFIQILKLNFQLNLQKLKMQIKRNKMDGKIW